MINFNSILSKSFLIWTGVFLFSCSDQETKTAEEQAQAPNIIIIYNDDLGYGDLSSYGSTTINTPNIDQLAEEGIKLTEFYVASPVCSPSRAALLTGSYPLRVGIPYVLAPHGISWVGEKWRHGLHPDEATLPEQLKSKGYSTAIFGKWHLGHLPEHLPGQHGFDYYYGIPYSNDMRPETSAKYPPLPIIENDRIVEENPDQSKFTSEFANKTIAFIDQQGSDPFFVYLANPMPHVPLYASDAFEGKSPSGLYADVIQEIDHSVGQIMTFLDQKGLRENTIVIFTSDNGPWLSYGNHAGSAGSLREGKHTTMEGGQRVPCIISWPGRIPKGESAAFVTNMDLMPTLLDWADAPLPSKPIDGISMQSLFEGKTAKSGRTEMLFYSGNELQAFRSGSWKLHQPHEYKMIGDRVGNDGERGKYEKGQIGWSLYDLSTDPGETTNLALQHPELMDTLKLKMLQQDSLLKAGSRKPFVFEGAAPKTGQLWH